MSELTGLKFLRETGLLSAVLCPWFDFGLPPQCPQVEEKLSHFLSRWLRTGWQSLTSQQKILEILRLGRKLNPSHGEDRQWDAFILPLSYHDCSKRDNNMSELSLQLFFQSATHFNRSMCLVSANWWTLAGQRESGADLWPLRLPAFQTATKSDYHL